MIYVLVLGGWILGSIIVAILLFKNKKFYDFCNSHGNFFDECAGSWIWVWPMCLLISIVELIFITPSEIVEKYWKEKSIK